MVLRDKVVTGTLDDISVQSLEPQLASSSHHEGGFESSTKLEIAKLTKMGFKLPSPKPHAEEMQKYSPTKGTTLVVRDAEERVGQSWRGAGWRSRLLFTREKNRILAEIFAIFTFLENGTPETSLLEDADLGVENELYFRQQKAQISEINCKLRDWHPLGTKKHHLI